MLDICDARDERLTAARALRGAEPPTAVVALTRHGDDAYVQELLSAGASGYVLKQSPSAELLTAIRAAAAGGRYLDPALPRARLPARSAAARGDAAGHRARDRSAAHDGLGHSNKDIASALDISVKTVEVHKANAMRKLDLRGRIDVVRYAVLNEWLRDP